MIYLRQREKLEDSDDDEGPQDEDAWLIEDLKVLAHLYSSLKDKEDLINLIFEVPSYLLPPPTSHFRTLGFHR